MMSEKLTEKVKKVQGDLNKEKVRRAVTLRKEVLDALALADQFSSIQPEVYVLPLDAMGGFCVANAKTELVLEAAV
ncbi:hypothetical protein [Mesorhizobium sp. M1143]|uniref:hypothetical protein n=1 Tax=Mesorhizobium sp. M1143 TaxID=2957061 RepID=UPI0033350D52